jgi:peptidoglycan/xylan/chitin deacetylase (PgdA/CDA1 family)
MRLAASAAAIAIAASLAACGSSRPAATAPAATPRTPAPRPVPPATTAPPRHPPATTAPPRHPPATSTSQARTVPVTGRLAGKDWTVIPTSRHVVALTFDAGANADGVAPILATLRREHVLASFFLTGGFAHEYPAASRAIAAAGMRLGDHTRSHPYLTRLSDAAIRQEILGGARQIMAVTGRDPAPLLRFPFGDANARTIAIANRLGYVPVRWTVDTLGWEGTAGHISVAIIVSRVLAALQPGEIVLMHAGSNPDDHTTLDAAALPRLITELRARGYSFVTLDALVG